MNFLDKLLTYYNIDIDDYNELKNPSSLLDLPDTNNIKGMDKVVERIGIERTCDLLLESDNLKELYDKITSETKCILVDEAQFLTAQQVTDLATIVDSQNVPVICFGLRTDFQGKLFEGSEALFEMADKLEEIKTVCQWCGHKATMNLRTADGKPAYDGDQVQIGDHEYLSVCRYHYLNPQI